MPHFSRPLREAGLVGSKEERGTMMGTRTFSTLQKKLFVCIFPLLLAPAWALSAQAPTPAFDLVITDAHIIDGTGSPWYSGDLGIRDGFPPAETPSEPKGRKRARPSLTGLANTQSLSPENCVVCRQDLSSSCIPESIDMSRPA
jgi:hypothetical protein